jgi:hypothetical protein
MGSAKRGNFDKGLGNYSYIPYQDFTTLSLEQLREVQLLVCEHARDKVDAEGIMEVLGIHPQHPTAHLPMREQVQTHGKEADAGEGVDA